MYSAHQQYTLARDVPSRELVPGPQPEGEPRDDMEEMVFAFLLFFELSSSHKHDRVDRVMQARPDIDITVCTQRPAFQRDRLLSSEMCRRSMRTTYNTNSSGSARAARKCKHSSLVYCSPH